MRLIATGLIWAALCGMLYAENKGKPKKKEPPVIEEMKKPVASQQQAFSEALAETLYEEPKPMKEADPNVRFGKIYDVINDPEVTAVADNRPMAYEFKYFNYGAITKQDLKNRRGHYFVINWKNAGPSEDLVLRFDYRQERSREKINTLEIPTPSAQGNLRGMFSVRGEAYEKLGKVNSWRVTVLRKGQIVAQKQSFIW